MFLTPGSLASWSLLGAMKSFSTLEKKVNEINNKYVVQTASNSHLWFIFISSLCMTNDGLVHQRPKRGTVKMIWTFVIKVINEF